MRSPRGAEARDGRGLLGYRSRVPSTALEPARTKTPEPPRPRRGEGALVALALAGVAVAIELTVLHARVGTGAGPSFCSISAAVNCDAVAASRWSAAFGVPLAAWGALAYLAVATLAASAFATRRPHPGWPLGLLVLATGLLSAAAVTLAAISELLIHTLCIMCALSWAISFALLALAVRLARRRGGVRAALAADLAALRARPVPASAGAGVLAVAAVVLLAGYSRVGPPSPATLPASALGTVIGPPGSIVVFEYSDYECPFCARVHETDKLLLQHRPDVRLVRRHFPLDQSCNPLLKRPFHQGSCDLARAGICAEAQGRFDEMDDALFRNQAEKAPAEVLAQRLGLDLPAFRACMASPVTEQRLQSDIAEGIRAGVKGTPSYEWNGRLQQGDLPTLLGATPASATR